MTDLVKTIVTIKVPRKKGIVRTHPQPKEVGECIVSNYCTDVNGAHHSFYCEGTSVETIESWVKQEYGHVTRIEVIEE